jgi:hypothetical protein
MAPPSARLPLLDLLLLELVVPLFYQSVCSTSCFGLCLFAGFGYLFCVLAGGF